MPKRKQIPEIEFKYLYMQGTLHGGYTRYAVYMRRETDPHFLLCVQEYECIEMDKVDIELADLTAEQLADQDLVGKCILEILEDYQVECAEEYRDELKRRGLNVCH